MRVVDDKMLDGAVGQDPILEVGQVRGQLGQLQSDQRAARRAHQLH